MKVSIPTAYIPVSEICPFPFRYLSHFNVAALLVTLLQFNLVHFKVLYKIPLRLFMCGWKGGRWREETILQAEFVWGCHGKWAGVTPQLFKKLNNKGHSYDIIQYTYGVPLFSECNNKVHWLGQFSAGYLVHSRFNIQQSVDNPD